MHSLRIQHNSIFVKWLFCTSRLINQISRPERYGFVLRRFRQFVRHLWWLFNQSLCSITWICQYMWVILNSNSACEFVVCAKANSIESKKNSWKRNFNWTEQKTAFTFECERHAENPHSSLSFSFSLCVCVLCFSIFGKPFSNFGCFLIVVYLRFISLSVIHLNGYKYIAYLLQTHTHIGFIDSRVARQMSASDERHFNQAFAIILVLIKPLKFIDCSG